jgi:hypothetical protein
MEILGRPVLIDPEHAAETQAMLGQPMAGWFQFQPLWDRIVREQPDFLD